MHWADVVASKLLQRGGAHRIASGTSISGLIHLGNAGDVIYAEGMARALHEKGAQAEVIWIADDVDPLRGLPEQIPPSFAQHLGKPVCNLPDPDGCHRGFTDHFILPFLESLERVGIRPIEKRGSAMYAAGEYDDAVRVSLRKAVEIRTILEEVSHSKKPEGWMPFDAICESCGRIATTDATSFEGDRIHYSCGGGVAGKKEMMGCGHQGTTGLRGGKLTWRVEWAARWKILGITCEPFGKEHSAAGGSYDTSKVISQQVFGYPPPEPVLYEYILVAGAKMSKSKGNVIALSQLLDVLPPEVVRYFYFRGEPNKHKDFDPAQKLPALVEEFERAQGMAAGRVSPSKREDEEDLSRSVALSQIVAGKPMDYGLIPFAHLVTICQISADEESALDAIRRSGFAPPTSTQERHLLTLRLERARAFVNTYVPAAQRIRVLEELADVPRDRLPEGSAPFFRALAGELERAAWEPEAIHNSIFAAAKAAGLPTAHAFKAVYLATCGQEKGPRAGYFLASLGRPFVLQRFEALAAPR